MRRAQLAALAAIAALVFGALAPGGSAGAAGATASAGAPEARSVSFSSTVDLADDQPVSIQGTGFRPGSFVDVSQCRPRRQGFLACDVEQDFDYARVRGDGTFTLTVRPQAVMTMNKGPFDCRPSPGRCELRLREEGAAYGVRRALTFAPDAPLAAPPTVTVDPSTGLVDGQVIDVAVEGLHANEDAYLFQCPTGARHLLNCTYSGEATASDTGALDAEVSVVAISSTSEQVSDCRTAPCELVVLQGFSYELGRRAGRAPLGFAPDGALRPPPVLTVTPATGLHHRQSVHVEGTGFRPLSYVVPLQCKARPGNELACDLRHYHGDFETNVNGDFTGDFTVHSTFRLLDGRLVDCANRPCSIGVLTTGADAPVTALIRFAPD